jgi:hypothetical protein
VTRASVFAPLSYPGEPPAGPGALVLGAAVIPLHSRGGRWVASMAGGARALDSVLAEAGAAPLRGRTPVLAVGSNASPAQLVAKFSTADTPVPVPVTAVTVHGLAVGVSAHVSVPGYLPATPLPEPDAITGLHVTWLDERGLAVIDATEPNYRRIPLFAGAAVHLPGGREVRGCQVYSSARGYLVDGAGVPRRLSGQATLIHQLLDSVPGLRAVAGDSPAEWLTRTRDPQVRDQIRELLRSAGMVRQLARAHPEAGAHP